MKTFLFAALSLVSGFSKEQEHEGIRNLEIEKTNAYMIEGRYNTIDNLCTLSVTATGTEDYLYTFDAANAPVYRNKEEVPVESLQDGDLIRITYDGTVSLEYPPKLNNVSKIEVVDEKEGEEGPKTTVNE